MILNDENIRLTSTITCLVCGHKKTEKMAVDSCQYFYKCEKCNTILKPLKSDCCVFCSFGTVRCPMKQTTRLKKSGDFVGVFYYCRRLFLYCLAVIPYLFLKVLFKWLSSVK